MNLDAKCKICRRQGAKLFLRGERCFSPKCAMVKRPYPPGLKGKRRKRAPSEYAKQLREKQKLKIWYGLSERYFKAQVMKILKKSRKTKHENSEDAAVTLIKLLESRLDNVVFKMGVAGSRAMAKQLVSYGYFKVNNRSVDIPSYRVKIGDTIKVKEHKIKKKIFQNINSSLKKQKPSDWLKLNPETLEAKVVSEPTTQVETLPVEISSIFEFYSR